MAYEWHNDTRYCHFLSSVCSGMVKNRFLALKIIQVEVWGKFIGHFDVVLSAFLQFLVKTIEKMAHNRTSC